MILVYLPTLCVVIGLSFFAIGYGYCDTSQGSQGITDAEDCDHWVHIRNVSIYDGATDGLQKDMFVLVTCTYIQKIGQTPLFIMDKDITFNINGEGKILLPITALASHPENFASTGVIAEGTPADFMIVEAESLADLHKFRDYRTLQGNQNFHDIEDIRLMMKNGEIIKNTLPRTRAAGIGLRKYQKQDKK